MRELLPIAAKLGELLKDRHETIAIAESSTGGLISAALLAVPGASAYFLGGAIVYTRESRRTLLDIRDAQALFDHLEPGRGWRRGSHRKSLWRSGGAQLYRPRRAVRARDHGRDRQRRPRRQHARLRGRRVGVALAEPRVVADAPSLSAPDDPNCRIAELPNCASLYSTRTMRRRPNHARARIR